MSIILTGVGVSSGICIGDAIIVNKDNINYSPSYIRKSQVKDEIKKFEKALSRLRQEYQKSINKIKNKTLDKNEIRKIGFPLVDSVVRRSFIATGGTVLATKLALNYGIACNTAGGSHHATSNEGAGFCVFNDVAVAAKYLTSRGLANKILIIDLDVHQGNGTDRKSVV